MIFRIYFRLIVRLTCKTTINPQEIQLISVLKKFNSFHSSLNFTCDQSQDEVHFLDIKIDRNKTDIYRKDTHTGQYVHFTSFEPWYRKTAWAKCLIERTERICSNKQLLDGQISKIKSFMSWNGYPRYVRNNIISKLKERKKNLSKQDFSPETEDTSKIWFRVPYIGPIGEKFAKQCIAKVHRYCKKDLKFILMYNTKKISFFCGNKDPVPKNIQSHVIYQFECPGCKAKYIGKTDRCLELRLNEHSDFHTSTVGKHLNECEHFHHIVNLYNISVYLEFGHSFIETYYHISSAIAENTRILDKNNNWTQLCFLELLYIKRLNPALNVGIKATKKLNLFR